jgi:hypothetical protein
MGRSTKKKKNARRAPRLLPDVAPPFVQIAAAGDSHGILLFALDAQGRVWELRPTGWVRHDGRQALP